MKELTNPQKQPPPIPNKNKQEKGEKFTQSEPPKHPW